MKNTILAAAFTLLCTTAALPNTLEKYLTYACSDPVTKSQKRAFQKVSPRERSLVMRTHIGELSAELALTQQQRDFLERAYELATPAAFSEGGRTQMVDDLSAQESPLFRDLPLWRKLSPGASSLLYSLDRKRSDYLPISMEGGMCSCTMGGTRDCEACSDGSARPCTQEAGMTCVPSDSGCGFLWMYPCNGYCIGCAIIVKPHEA